MGSYFSGSINNLHVYSQELIGEKVENNSKYNKYFGKDIYTICEK